MLLLSPKDNTFSLTLTTTFVCSLLLLGQLPMDMNGQLSSSWISVFCISQTWAMYLGARAAGSGWWHMAGGDTGGNTGSGEGGSSEPSGSSGDKSSDAATTAASSSGSGGGDGSEDEKKPGWYYWVMRQWQRAPPIVIVLECLAWVCLAFAILNTGRSLEHKTSTNFLLLGVLPFLLLQFFANMPGGGVFSLEGFFKKAVYL